MGISGAREAMVKTGDLLEGRYRIIKTLGEGGMGTVFLAEHALIKRRVAIKILHSELATDADVIERFMNEARAAGTLGHPNIVESTDMGFTQTQVPYIVFEFLEGTLLTDEIYRVGGLPLRRAVRIAQQIASALHAAHVAGIVHRDLKSDNIFLTDKDDALDHVKVLDFGISRFLEADDEQTRRGVVMGTPEFMAPEQITAPQSVDKRADIYALGVILYEMLTARRPFAGDDEPRALLDRIVRDVPPPLQRPEVPHAMAEMIHHRLLAKDPRDRYQSMVDVEAALDAFTTQGDVPRIRRSRPIPAVSVTEDDIARRSDVIPRPAPTLDTPYPGIMMAAPAHKRPVVMYGLAGAGLLVGVLGIALAMRGGSKHVDKPVAVAPAPAPLPAAAVPATPAVQKITVALEANVPNARVTFRRRVNVAPATMQLTPSDIVELVEVSAPGYRTMRYWITFDRPTKLVAQLGKGNGAVEATEEQTLIALGEVQAPAAPAPIETPKPAAAVVAVATVAPAAAPKMTGEPEHPMPRKIGRSEETPVETPVETPAVDTPVESVVAGKSEAIALPAQAEVPNLPDPTKAEPAIAKAELPKAELPKAESPKAEEPKDEMAKFDTATVTSVVGKNRMEVMKCFADGKKSNPTMKGTVNVHMFVDAGGKVKRVQIQSTLGSPLVAACVAKSVNAWKFPTRSATQLAMVSYPFTIN
jgi:tRNA A-37 threonylcarbamoyl transferase component Bud32